MLKAVSEQHHLHQSLHVIIINNIPSVQQSTLSMAFFFFIVCEKLSSKLPEYRTKQVTTGLSLNITLVNFFKDVIEVGQFDTGFKMITNHIQHLDLISQRTDRECFRDIMSNLFTPKIFLFSLLSPDGTSLTYLDVHFIPSIEEGIPIEQHTDMVFRMIFQILSQYNKQQYLEFIHSRLIQILHAIDRKISVLQSYKLKTYRVNIFCVSHYLFYYLLENKSSINEKWTDIAKLMLRSAVHFKGDDRQKLIKECANQGSEDLTKRMLSDVKAEARQISGARKFASLKQTRTSEVISRPTERVEITRTFDTLAFCTQIVLIKPIIYYDAVYVINNIISEFFDVHISPYIESDVYDAIGKFIEVRPLTFFCGINTRMKHIIHKIIAKPNVYNIRLLDKIRSVEISSRIPCGFVYKTEKDKDRVNDCEFVEGKDYRTKSLVARALLKCKQDEHSIDLLRNTSYGPYIESVYILDCNLTPEMKASNPDIYSDLLFKKLTLLEPSPDARVEVLMQLYEHQYNSGYKSEALMSQLCAAALVSEYMWHFKKIPFEFFRTEHPAEKFISACPPANCMVLQDDKVRLLPVMPGYCTSKYFSEFGLIYLIQLSMDIAKGADLYEISTRIHGVLSPIAQHRHLWRVLQKHYITGQLSWLIAAKMYTASDRRLGSYYKVEFPDDGVYIYRETVLTNLWQVCNKIEKSSKFYAGDKTVEVVSEGTELDRKKYNDPNKYYVHVKHVNQFFTPDERQKRMTVFEKNHNIDQFYFDVPFSKDAQSGLEHCWLKRTIFTLPSPLPYLISRVHVPPENIQQNIFEPIEYAVQNIQSQVSKINEACARVSSEFQSLKPGDGLDKIQSFKELQPLIQGSLLVQVNEGPEKMAEVFLNGEEKPHQDELRKAFREFIQANTAAVKLHGKIVMKYPIYAVLQEELDLGINKLTSKLQQYLK